MINKQTATQFIWAALQRTLTVTVLKNGKLKKIHYKVPEFEDVPDDHCWLCGAETKGCGLLKKRKITKMFSDTEYAQFPNSRSLCMACGGLLSNAAMRFYSLLATTDGLWHPTRREWREILLNPPQSAWVGCLAISCQKHLFYRGEINFSSSECIVALEDYPVTYQPEELKELLFTVEGLLETFSKEEVLSGRYSQARVMRHGLERWRETEHRLENVRGSRLLELAIYVAIKIYKEKESEGEKKCNPCASQLNLLSIESPQ